MVRPDPRLRVPRVPTRSRHGPETAGAANVEGRRHEPGGVHRRACEAVPQTTDERGSEASG